MRTTIYVFGRGGHAQAVAQFATTLGVSADRQDYEALRNGPWSGAIVGVGCSDMALRERLFDEIMARHYPADPLVQFRNAGHLEPIGAGTVIFPSVIGDAWVGRNVVVYSGCVIEHGSTVADHAWLSPGVILCGNVTVSPRAFLGAGAIVLPGVTIGKGARIGAGAVIHDDVSDGATVYGPKHSLEVKA